MAKTFNFLDYTALSWGDHATCWPHHAHFCRPFDIRNSSRKSQINYKWCRICLNKPSEINHLKWRWHKKCCLLTPVSENFEQQNKTQPWHPFCACTPSKRHPITDSGKLLWRVKNFQVAYRLWELHVLVIEINFYSRGWIYQVALVRLCTWGFPYLPSSSCDTKVDSWTRQPENSIRKLLLQNGFCRAFSFSASSPISVARAVWRKVCTYDSSFHWNMITSILSKVLWA